MVGGWRSCHSSALSHKRSWRICRRAIWIYEVSNRVRHCFELVECRSVAVTLQLQLQLYFIQYLLRFGDRVSPLCVDSRNLLLIKRSQWLPWLSDSSNTAVFLLLRSYRGACFQANYDPVELSRSTLHLRQDWMTCKGFLAFKKITGFWI